MRPAPSLILLALLSHAALGLLYVVSASLTYHMAYRMSWLLHAQWTSCRYSDHAPHGIEAALRGASVVLVVVTTDFIRSKYCLDELHWAYDEMRRRRSQAQQGQQPLGALVLLPIFYHDQDSVVGFGVDSFQRNTLSRLLRRHHAVASTADRVRWLDALLGLAQQTGIRQDAVGRCADAS